MYKQGFCNETSEQGFCNETVLTVTLQRQSQNICVEFSAAHEDAEQRAGQMEICCPAAGSFAAIVARTVELLFVPCLSLVNL